MVACPRTSLVAEPLEDFESPPVQGLGGVIILPIECQAAELVVVKGQAGLVAESLAGVQGAAAEGLGGVVVSAVVGQDAELVVAVGEACLVAEPLPDFEDRW